VASVVRSSRGDGECHLPRELRALKPHDALEQTGVEVRLDVVGEAVDVVVDRRRDALANRQAAFSAQPVQKGAAQRRMVKEAVEVGAADQASG